MSTHVTHEQPITIQDPGATCKTTECSDPGWVVACTTIHNETRKVQKKQFLHDYPIRTLERSFQPVTVKRDKCLLMWVQSNITPQLFVPDLSTQSKQHTSYSDQDVVGHIPLSPFLWIIVVWHCWLQRACQWPTRHWTWSQGELVSLVSLLAPSANELDQPHYHFSSL